MTEDEARVVAEAYVARESTAAGEDLALLVDETRALPFGWVFFYDTRAFVESGDPMTRAVGNAPLIVDRRSGQLHVTGTARPLEDYLALYDRFGTCHP